MIKCGQAARQHDRVVIRDIKETRAQSNSLGVGRCEGKGLQRIRYMFVGFRHTLATARAEANTLAVKELETLGIPAPDNFDQYLVMRKQLNRYLAPADLQWLSKQDSLIRA